VAHNLQRVELEVVSRSLLLPKNRFSIPGNFAAVRLRIVLLGLKPLLADMIMVLYTVVFFSAAHACVIFAAKGGGCFFLP
jgi:hypothetical protein